MSTNADLASLFEQAADLLALLGENSFKVLAHRKVARVLEDLPQDVASLISSLDDLPGVGESSAEKIKEYLRTGSVGEFTALRQQVPAGVVQMLAIPSLGVKTAAQLWHEAGITDIATLKQKLDDGSLLTLKGMGEKKIAKIKANLAFVGKEADRVRVDIAMAIAQSYCALLEQPLKQGGAATQVQYCGSLRRGRETIGDLDILVCGDAAAAGQIAERLRGHSLTGQIVAAGDTKITLRTRADLQVDVRIVPAESWGAALQYFTGSKEHNVKLRERAVRQGLKLNEWGLFRGDKPIAGLLEQDIYQSLGLAAPPPEVREDHGELEQAESLFKANASWQLVTMADIQGDLHMHTTASDGSQSIDDIVAEAKRRGLKYIAITDHSKSQFQARGLTVPRLIEHVNAIRAVARKAKDILVLAGSEVDILADGSLDYEDDVLAQLDWVVASPHAALAQDSDKATIRLVRAASHPLVHVLGHPTGRLVGTRRGLEPDMPQVISAARRSGIAIEINANAHRLDLRDVHVRLALEAGVPICINTDAHSFDDFDQLPFGVLTARRGWAKASDVLNARSVADFKSWLDSRRGAAHW